MSVSLFRLSENSILDYRLVNNDSNNNSGVLEQRRKDGPWGSLCRIQSVKYQDVKRICTLLGFAGSHPYFYAYLSSDNASPLIWNTIFIVTTQTENFQKCSPDDKALNIVCLPGKRVKPEYSYIRQKRYCLFALHTNWERRRVGGSSLLFVFVFVLFFYCSNTVLTNGFGDGGWKIYQVGGPQGSYTTYIV